MGREKKEKRDGEGGLAREWSVAIRAHCSRSDGEAENDRWLAGAKCQCFAAAAQIFSCIVHLKISVGSLFLQFLAGSTVFPVLQPDSV